MFLGLRTIIYPAPDLSASRDWFARLLGVQPYFDVPFYVAFRVGGYELGLDPNADLGSGPITYWGVIDIDGAVARLLDTGACLDTPVRDVGGDIRVATVREPGGSLLGVIYNPHFRTDPGSAPPVGT